ncbi:hypothetical protein SAMN05445756_0957 [Kytococcus aerolatus]|uniref:Uncharacterized protein n=1 Tax=Kytococcus aerolatus TaxID=592308 RepID=A0A212TCD1_9MICO|nr:hypothetical protein [Kytococcus aerolatus]SNC63683.1 hypothetical protein SAMN05445756_0957 [Kytococcus aerolatus]
MPPSVLVLVLVVVLWIGFGLQWWWRRREHVQTVKSMDAFLDAMEALEKTVNIPDPVNLDRGPSRRVQPTAASAPTVTVKARRDPQSVADARRREAERQALAERRTELFALGSVGEQLRERSVRAGLILASALGLLVSTIGAVAGAISWFWVLACVVAVAASVAWSRWCAEQELRGAGLRITSVRRGAAEASRSGRASAGRARVPSRRGPARSGARREVARPLPARSAGRRAGRRAPRRAPGARQRSGAAR